MNKRNVREASANVLCGKLKRNIKILNLKLNILFYLPLAAILKLYTK